MLVVVITAAAWMTAPAGPAAAAPRIERVCPAARPRHAACTALRLVPVAATAAGVQADATPLGFGPADLQSAYGLSAGLGAGQTVAIVDAYDAPNAESDLAVYRAQFGLPACTTANGCFRKVNENGQTVPLPVFNSGWASEINLDLDMVSATCPSCHILLVEANSNFFPDLGTAVNQAASLGAVAISNSYGGSESAGETSVDALYYDHPGIAVTVSAGDSGYGVEYPAASPHVIAVGGTSLVRDGSSRGWSESVWGSGVAHAKGTGSGCSAFEPKPAFQTDTGCSRRTVADVSAVADPNTGVAVYDQGLWNIYGGTSVASPIVAAIFANATPPAPGAYPAQYLYADPGGLNDVTSGLNGVCSVSYLCHGGVGYDGPTGLGTPNGLTAFGPVDIDHLVLSPASASAAPGAGVTYSAEEFDAHGNDLGDVTATSTFTIAPDGSCSGSTCSGSAVGPHTVTATLGLATGTASLQVAAGALEITTTSLPNATAGQLYDVTIQADGGVMPYHWSVVRGALPAGLGLNVATGEIAGTPSPGLSKFTIQLADSAQPSAHTVKARLTIQVVPAAITISPSILPGATINHKYSLSFSASGGSARYAFAVVAGSLPPGLTLSARGKLSGIPTQSGTYVFTVQATDKFGYVGTIQESLTVT